MSEHEGPVAGWYPDPEVPGGERYWDGSAWTEHRRSTPTSPEGAPPGGTWDAAAAGAPSAGAATWATAEPIDTWLWQSIVATMLCCQPLGIVGIVMSAMAGSARDVGNMTVARQRAAQARTWTLAAVGVGLATYLVVLLFMMLGLFAAW